MLVKGATAHASWHSWMPNQHHLWLQFSLHSIHQAAQGSLLCLFLHPYFGIVGDHSISVKPPQTQYCLLSTNQWAPAMVVVLIKTVLTTTDRICRYKATIDNLVLQQRNPGTIIRTLSSETTPISRCQRSFWVWAQPMRDDVTMQHHVPLTEPIHSMISEILIINVRLLPGWIVW